MKKNKAMAALLWAAGVVLLWEGAAFCLVNIFHDKMASAKLPYLHSIIYTITANFSEISSAALLTISKAAIGFALGAAAGIILAVIMSISKIAEKIAFPYLIISQMIPVLGLAPIIFNLVRNMDLSRTVSYTHLR
ncbi:MAG: ABC transporter permease, partial [Oscillospiraceae bacterium]|nr:ABC transporter permease [Oscillospiraceae bacterium]